MSHIQALDWGHWGFFTFGIIGLEIGLAAPHLRRPDDPETRLYHS